MRRRVELGLSAAISALWIALLPVLSTALTPNSESVFVRVVDVGAGLCCVIVLPDGRCIVYDAGNYENNGRYAMSALQSLVPPSTPIELLVLSHTDADHIAAVPQILTHYDVRRVLRAGLSRDSRTWRDVNAAIEANPNSLDLNLAKLEYPSGATYRFGEVFVTVVCGFSAPPEEWDLDGSSEFRNAGSIVVRVTYAGSSVLFCGDAVGRHNGQAEDTTLATELYMLEAKDVIPLRADVVVAPHHGADNGSSSDWIREVNPQWVIFSAGHKYEHPRASTAQRYLDLGVPADHLLRTDRDDDEGGKEWPSGAVAGNVDGPGDDSVDILLRADGSVEVAYAENPIRPSTGVSTVGSRLSAIYHYRRCADAARIRNENLVEFDVPPPERRLHRGCPR